MILYMGDNDIYDFIKSFYEDIDYNIPVENADKLIISSGDDRSVAAVKAAVLINLPVLGILDGYSAVVKAFEGTLEGLDNCPEGKQEFAVIDATSPIYSELESVIRICRGKPVALVESSIPADLDCMSRAETGEIIAVRNKLSAKEYGNVYAINFYPHSGLTPDGRSIIEKFINN